MRNRPAVVTFAAVAIAAMLLLTASCGGNTCDGSVPIPKLNSLSPNPVPASQALEPVVVTLHGSGFVPASKVMQDGIPLAVTYKDSEHLQVTVNLNGAQSVGIWVDNPNKRDLAGEIAGAIMGCPDGGQSDTVHLMVGS